MYVLNGSFNAVVAYIEGYLHGSNLICMTGEYRYSFNRYVSAKYRYPQKWWWAGVIRDAFPDDKIAMEELCRLLKEYVSLAAMHTPEEIDVIASQLRKNYVEGEPEKAWRKLSRAIHRGQRSEIEPLIQHHPEASVLWDDGSYPESVSSLLDEIQEAEAISVVSGTEADGEVEIITPDFGRLNVKFIDNTWRVDVSKIIRIRRASRPTE